jgi:hypothetical protein
MARLYIANLGRQPHDLPYRVPAEVGWSRQTQTRRIPPGAQQQIHIEAPLQVLEGIVEQHRQYGIIEASEVHKIKGFVGLCFSFDRPVLVEQLEYGVDHNLGALQEQGMKNLQETALDVDRAFEGTLMDAQQRGEIRGSTRVKAVHVETLEDSDTPKYGQGIKVDHLAVDRSDVGMFRRRV